MREQFHAIARLLPDPLLLLSADGRILAANPPAEKLLDGAAGGSCEGRSLLELCAGAPDDTLGYLRLCARSGHPLPGSLTLRVPSGDVRIRCEGAGVSAAPGERLVQIRLRRSDEESSFVLLNQKIEQLNQEILRRKAVQEKLEASESRLRHLYEVEAKARAEAREANRRKDEFLAILGHELRNPLAPIVTALQLMRMRGPDAFQREREVIDRQVRHMVGLVDDLLDVSRVTRGKVELKRQRGEIAPLIAKAAEMASPLLEQRAHELVLHVPASGLAVDVDPGRIAQALGNLLTNAAKYTEPRGRIVVTAGRERDEVVIRVQDSGIGISPEVLPHVFELFVQEGRSLARSQGGLGIGLNIVRSLVELHGGSVTAHSEGLGKGSEFVVRLPALPLASCAAAADEGPAPAAYDASAPPPSQDAARAAVRVLLVDDNADAAEVLAEALRSFGYTPSVAHDGPTALQAAARIDPTVAIVDIGLPVMDGYELARHLRHQHPQVRLVALTGYGQPTDRALAREAGFDEHLVKPVELARLGQALDALTSSRRIESAPPPP